MDWDEVMAGLQLLAEERIGTLVREEAARDDAAFEAVMTPEPDA